MTMMKRDSNSIWSRVREDKDIDDLIFGDDFYYYGHEESEMCSER